MIDQHYISAFLIGLLGSSHCLGMCGGISAALGLTSKGSILHIVSRLFAYNLGRVSCYTLLGILFGTVFWYLGELARPILFYLRLLAGLLLIAMGLYISQWWMGLTRLEQAGQCIWKRVQPLASRLQPIDTLSKTFVTGLIWGLLPCGLVYSTVVWAGMNADWLRSGLTMLCFGLGTIPAMLVTGFGSASLQQKLKGRLLRQAIGLLLIGFGVWTLYSALSHHL